MLDAVQVKALRPRGQLITDFTTIPITQDTVATVKCDGEFQVIPYGEDEIRMLNQWGRERTEIEIPALAELKQKLEAHSIKQALLSAECYTVSGEKMLKLPSLTSTLKGVGNKDQLRLGVFDLHELNNRRMTEPYKWKLQELGMMLGTIQNGTKAYVVPFTFPNTAQDLAELWKTYVEAKDYEGLFVRSNSDYFKVKPRLEADAVIIGINKDHDTFQRQEARSLKLALIDQHGYLTILGDVGSGITQTIGRSLWSLTEHKIADDEKTMWIKPFAVVTVVFESLYPKEQTRFNTKGDFYEIGKVPFVSMRHPRLERFRPDKQATHDDIPTSQVLNGEERASI